jgi:hypothetical protein
MLIYERVPFEKVQIGDRIRVEVNRVEIVAKVVASDYGQGTLRITPYAYVVSSRGGSSMRSCPRALMSRACVVQMGGKEISVLRPFGFRSAYAVALTWEQIAELEPRVLIMLDQIKSERPTIRNFVGIWLKYLDQLSALLGFGREDATHPELRSDAAYKTVHEKLLNSLRDPE